VEKGIHRLKRGAALQRQSKVEERRTGACRTETLNTQADSSLFSLNELKLKHNTGIQLAGAGISSGTDSREARSK
jgi:hypothetical protein